MAMSRPSWAPVEVDPSKPSVARVYDFYLGGSHNFESDREFGRQTLSHFPGLRQVLLDNRTFLRRVVLFLVAQGVDQFLDLGSGIPTVGNVHEVAQQASPGARVVYADVDPVAIAHSKAILAGNENAAIIDADLHDPGHVLGDPAVRRLIDFGQPAGLLLVMVLHFINDAADPWQIVATLRDALPAGSYLVLAHATNESRPAVAQAAETVYNRSVSTDIHMRSRAEILRFFDGFELVEPGLVYIPQWRPDSPDDVPGDPGKFWGLVGVARKP